MKKRNKIKGLGILFFLIPAFLTGCASINDKTSFDYTVDNGGSYVEQLGESPEIGEPMPEDSNPAKENYVNSENTVVPKEETLKVVSMLRMTAESKEFEGDIENLENKVHLLKGYISSHEIKTFEGSGNRKEANISIRVPRENASELVEFIKNNLSIILESSQTIDITDAFYDTEARIKNLESQESQLRILYDRTNSIEEVLLVNDKLNEVIREKESLTKSFMGMKERTSYSTIDIVVKEVSELTVKESIDDTLMDKVTKGLYNSWRSLKSGIADLIVTLSNSMSFIVLLVIGIIIFNKHFKGFFIIDPVKKEPDKEKKDPNEENTKENNHNDLKWKKDTL